MSRSPSPAAQETGRPPAPGDALYIEGVLGAPWLSQAIAVSGDTVTMAAPRRAGVATGLASGREFLLAYSVREVPCEVDAIWLEGPVRVGDDEIVIARMAGPPRRMQRREAVRVPVSIVVRASIEDEQADEPVSVAAITENLSAGGALLRMADAVEAGTQLTVTIQPPGSDEPPMDLPARVVRSDRETGNERPWRVALAFDHSTRAEHEALVRYVFRIQREWRGRETGMRS
jgi:hypothetical protein